MSKPFYMDLEGFKAIQDRLLKAPDRIKKEVAEEIKDGAQVIAEKAQLSARNQSFDQGRLVAGIKAVRVVELEYDVLSLESYSAFIEWGTGKRAKVPAKYQNYAAQFRGLKTGSAEEALFAITAWVKRKGIRFESAGTFKGGANRGRGKPLTLEQTAYIIFHSIMINGIKARPFLFHNFEAQEPIIIKNIETVLKDIL